MSPVTQWLVGTAALWSVWAAALASEVCKWFRDRRRNRQVRGVPQISGEEAAALLVSLREGSCP